MLDLDVQRTRSVSDVIRDLAVLESNATQPQLAVATTSDDDCLQVESELFAITGGRDGFAAKVGSAIRRSYDQVYDGQRTGRFHWAQLSKTEKTNAGSLVEIWLDREIGLCDGITLDFQIAGHDVDCKFSQKAGGWMLPPEVVGHLAMLITADDYLGTYSVGLVRVTAERINASTNRDAKGTLNRDGRAAIHWLVRDEPLPPNTLLRLPPKDVVAIMGSATAGRPGSGQRRLDELFRRAEGLRITRTVIGTVAQQEDPMKRVRSNGGSRSRLAAEGFLLLGHYRTHREVARALNLPVPNSGEIVSARVVPSADATRANAEIDGSLWRRWTPGDPVVVAPPLPHIDSRLAARRTGI